MSKLQSLKLKLQKMLEQFSQLSTDKGIITWSGDEEMPVVGDTIRLLDEDGNEVKAEDGEYKSDTVSIKVEGDKVVEIVDIVVEDPAEPATEPVEEPTDEPVVIDEPIEEPVVEEPVVEDPVEEPTDEPQEEPATEPVEEEPTEDERDAKIAELEAEIARLKEEIERLQKMSAAKPADEEFKSVNKINKTGNKKIDRLIDIINA